MNCQTQEKFGIMVTLKGNEIKYAKIEDCIAKQKLVDEDCQAVKSAVAVGVSFGTENL